jgi:ADP-heptose:LPS heptosyltransferase
VGLTLEPYGGQHLGPRPHVAVLFRDQIGDFIVASPLLRGIRERFPDVTLDYFGGERTRELEEASPLVDARYSLYGPTGPMVELGDFLAARRAAAGPYVLAINLESSRPAAEASGLIAARYVVGACRHPLSGEALPHGAQHVDRLWDDTWNRPNLLVDYPELASQYIGEIFCRLARIETDTTKTEAPTAEPPTSTPRVLVSTGANRSAKLWPAAHWAAIIPWLRSAGEEVGLLGAAPSLQGSAYHAGPADAAVLAAGAMDLRGRLTLPQVAGALARAAAFVTVDNGLMHLAGAVGAPTIALFGASPRRIWAPPSPSVRLLEPAEPCGLCEENRFQNADCLLPLHKCMLSVDPRRVIAELARLLEPLFHDG